MICIVDTECIYFFLGCSVIRLVSFMQHAQNYAHSYAYNYAYNYANHALNIVVIL